MKEIYLKGEDEITMEKECLVTKAMNKCDCKLCKQLKELRVVALKWQVQTEISKILFDTLEKKK